MRERYEPQCGCCGGTPTYREGARLYPCDECGWMCCSTCLGRSMCNACAEDANERDQDFPDAWERMEMENEQLERDDE